MIGSKEMECYEDEVQPYWNIDYKLIIILQLSVFFLDFLPIFQDFLYVGNL